MREQDINATEMTVEQLRNQVEKDTSEEQSERVLAESLACLRRAKELVSKLEEDPHVDSGGMSQKIDTLCEDLVERAGEGITPDVEWEEYDKRTTDLKAEVKNREDCQMCNNTGVHSNGANIVVDCPECERSKEWSEAKAAECRRCGVQLTQEEVNETYPSIDDIREYYSGCDITPGESITVCRYCSPPDETKPRWKKIADNIVSKQEEDIRVYSDKETMVGANIADITQDVIVKSEGGYSDPDEVKGYVSRQVREIVDEENQKEGASAGC